ncbi:non-ribosomal peptide synthetase [Verminephrobacter aporrectodeae]|uniref:non-ribosomal peptide synthetase n=1 Tax=Verminephrobacter aporrectodeae TaxID=1110389 RepID=UPI0022434658|nr:non-ribosomal peptide synthetase [Verminephrobacter aporrectodeae]
MHELLTQTVRAGIRLELQGDELRVFGPAHALTPELRAALQANKAALIENLRSLAEPSAPDALPELVADPAHAAEPFPLSDVQHAYWVGRHYAVESGQVATHFYCELDAGQVDCGRIERALQRLIERHGMLRAVVDATGLQRVLDWVPPYCIDVVDCTGRTPQEAQAAVMATRERMSHEVRPASQWPLFGVHATRMSDGALRLHVSLDMLTMDAWSMFVLFKEWHALYTVPDVELPSIRVTYRDYLLAERKLLGGPRHQRARDYWLNRMDQLPAAPDLPVVSERVGSQAPMFSRRRFRMDATRWSRVRERVRHFGLTPSGLLLAAYAEVLTRWSAAAHYTLNLTLFNRLPLHEDVLRMVGDFTSLSMLEVDHRDLSTAFIERAQAMQRQLMQDLEHREFSGVQVLREWTQRHKMGLTAAMPVVFTSALVLSGNEAGQDAALVERFGPMVYGVSQTPQVWLDNQVMEISGDLVLNWDAVDALFEPCVLDDMFAAYGDVLNRLADSDEAWTARSLMAPGPKEEGIPEDPQCAGTSSPGRLLHAGLVEHAARRPEAIAVIAHDRTMRYQELLSESLAVAHWLQSHGVQAGALVGVVTRKGWEQVVAVLGTLLAGAAYMPVDANLPIERQRELIETGRATCLLTQVDSNPVPRHLGVAKELAVLEIVAAVLPAAVDPGAVRLLGAPRNLAYVMFTSGSTGQPKGVMITHAAASRTIDAVNQLLRLEPKDRILSVSSLSFDLSVYDIFGALAAGAAVVLPDPVRRLDATHWADLIGDHGVTIWNSAPQLMCMLVDVCAGAARVAEGTLRAVLLSGDWIPVDLPARILACHPQAMVTGLGGATEAAIWSIWYPIGALSPHWTSIPYGRSMPGQCVEVVNDRFERCPRYVRGRIVISGDGLALGYWENPERTAERFVTSPSGQRCYETGDLGRYLPDGAIEFLGRSDEQVKIRGHRVEPGEIAAVLRQHPGVLAAAVLATGDRAQRELVAYIQPDKGHLSSLGMVLRSDPMPSLAHRLSEGLGTCTLRPADATLRIAWDRLDDYYLAAVVLAFGRLGFLGRSSGRVTPSDMLRRGVVDRYERWLQRAFDALHEAGLLREVGTRVYEATDAWDAPDLGSLSKEVRELLQSVFDFSAQDSAWFTDAVERLSDILTEHLHSAEIYTADATARVYQKLFLDNHQQLARVCEILLGCRRRTGAAILEVGAGLGSATRHVLNGLPADTRYVFTDISEFFLRRAAELFGEQHRGLAFARYDVDVLPEFQGIQRNSFDLVLASSMLHDVKDVALALEHLIALLKPGGQLVILEETRFFRSFDLHMGLQQGFDGFTDTGLRHKHCLLSRTQWEQAMRAAGFVDVMAVQAPGAAIEFLGFGVIVATAPEQALVLDRSAVKEYLASRLPDYMVAQHVVHLQRLPVTQNGKIDYKMLPPVPAAMTEHTERVAPRSELEVQLHAIWQRVLRTSALGITDNFFELGGDSLIATQMVREIRETFGVDLEIHEFLLNASIQALATLLEARSNVGSTGDSLQTVPAVDVFPALADGTADADLPRLMAQLPSASALSRSDIASAVSQVLLTGSSGWVGAYVLADLLDTAAVTVVCPVRARSDADAHQRVVHNLGRYGLHRALEQVDRIRAVAADLRRPQFGVSDACWSAWCQEIERIVHVAASVDIKGDYAGMRDVNAVPCLDLVRLASTGRLKPIVFASTLGVCIRRGVHGFAVRPGRDLDGSSSGLVMGYAQSKWVAEQLLWRARELKVPVELIRIPHIVPAVGSPCWKTNTILGSVLQVALTISVDPIWADSHVDALPVDRVARALGLAVLAARPTSTVRHLRADAVQSLPEVIQRVRQGALATTAARVELDRWLATTWQTVRDRYDPGAVILSRLLAPTDAGVLLQAMFGPVRVDVQAGSGSGAPAKKGSGPDYWLHYGRQCAGQRADVDAPAAMALSAIKPA